MATTNRVQVFLCGEPFRRDDGVAAAAGCLLPEDATALAEVHEIAELTVDALLALPAEAVLLVADACAGIEPGRVRLLPLSGLARGTAGSAEIAGSAASSHVMPLSATLALAAELRGSPVQGTFVCVGAADLGYGEGLSPVVAAALPAFAEAIAAEICDLAATLPAGATAAGDGPRNGRIGP